MKDHSSAAAEGEAMTSQYISFLVGDRFYGVDIMRVREIKQWTPTTGLPNQPPYTRGVLNLRGTIVPVHDLRARFGGPVTEATDTHVIVIVRIGEQIVGVLVDAVSDILTVASGDILPVPSSMSDVDSKSLSGLVNTETGMVALLDLEGLFRTDISTAA
ncbi:purine-binding chemotaxis protein CheW [Rubricella aquisinus]|uniref:Purine-binding chemotaxis protein CheW n=1 Tax=Rubricella aquisinus TaxID=2028108 RepID=A0A840X493_9RHOB|nr:chemotaxis protein CheW [Rubricella aquisinus]MBB5516655.1 purine-binding chemotaxis protein CheW [Rubricella aquisinus]